MIDVLAFVDRAPRAKRGGVEPVRAGDLVALVKRVKRAPELNVANLRARDEELRALAEKIPALIPARWGSVVADEAALEEKMAPLAAALAEALELVRGRAQMTARYVAGPIFNPKKRAKSGTEYLEARAREHTAPEIEPLRARLAKLVRAERVTRNARLRTVTVDHLVDRERADEWRAIFDGARLEALRLSGPSPAYAFAPEAGA